MTGGTRQETRKVSNVTVIEFSVFMYANLVHFDHCVELHHSVQIITSVAQRRNFLVKAEYHQSKRFGDCFNPIQTFKYDFLGFNQKYQKILLLVSKINKLDVTHLE